MKVLLDDMGETSGNIVFSKILEKFGVTRAVRWTLLTQGVRLLTGPLTLMLYLKYLDIETQGYVYTFSSVLMVSVFLEMGFSQNILQFASHEYARLNFKSDKSLQGDEVAYSRLISLGRLSFKYYGVASGLFLILLLVGGEWFFSSAHQVGVDWRGPWYVICTTASAALLLNPCWAILEGCDQIAEVEKFRFYSSILGIAGMAVGLVMGFGLYAVCLTSVINLVVSVTYVVGRWRAFFRMFTTPPAHGVISWRKEIWPFQWRIAVSWICGYFIFTLITPAVFRLAGPAAAGRIGFTLQLARLVATVASSWATTRLPELGMLVSRCDWTGLSEAWRKSTLMSVGITLLGGAAMICAMEAAIRLLPDLAGRYGGWGAASLFIASMVLQAAINSFAYYLRAFKEEPFMWLSVFQAVASFVLIGGLTRWQGEIGAAMGYLLSTLLTFYPALRIYIKLKPVYVERQNAMADFGS